MRGGMIAAQKCAKDDWTGFGLGRAGRTRRDEQLGSRPLLSLVSRFGSAEFDEATPEEDKCWPDVGMLGALPAEEAAGKFAASLGLVDFPNVRRTQSVPPYAVSNGLMNSQANNRIRRARWKPQSIWINGRKSSLRLEPIMWESLDEIAGRQGISRSELLNRIEKQHSAGYGSLASAIRVYIVEFYRGISIRHVGNTRRR
jgi:predicted DNA-binding ribbon-helix-helix protein